MKKSELIAYFPAGGKAPSEIEISEVLPTKQEGVLMGIAALPPAATPKKVLIYMLEDEGVTELRAIPAMCPHQGADISGDILKNDGNVYCHLHKRPICVFSEYNYSFMVEQRQEQFFIQMTT